MPKPYPTLLALAPLCLAALGCQQTATHVKQADDLLAYFGERQVTVRLNKPQVTWQGWGASLSWWANMVGRSAFAPTYADLFFSTHDVALLQRQIPGLGFNVVRYNIGGTGAPEDGKGELVSPIMPEFRKISGFWPDKASGAWRWERDANQRNMLQLAVERGADQVEFFCNSPMWWMMDSKSADGGTLPAENIADYTLYLSKVVDYAASNWRIKATSVAPFNEPSAHWWVYPKNQEGASIPPDLQPRVLASLRQQLDSLQHKSIILAGADENSVQDAELTLLRYQNSQVDSGAGQVVVNSLVNRLNVHGYFGGTNPQRDNIGRSVLRATAGGQPIWVSEYTDGDATGLTLARTIMQDLNYLQPSAWVYWQPAEPGKEWGFVYADYRSEAEGGVLGQALDINTKYFVMALFSRFIRPGQTLYESGNGDTLLSYDSAAHRLTVLADVEASPQQVRYDLSHLDHLPQQATVTMTSFDGGKLLSTWQVPIKGSEVVLDVGSKGVYALTLDGVTTSEQAAPAGAAP